MRVEQLERPVNREWSAPDASAIPQAHLVLVFGPAPALLDPAVMIPLRTRYQNALLFGCSTAGEIMGSSVQDDTVAVTAVAFESTTVRLATTRLENDQDSRLAGRRLAERLAGEELAHVFVLSDGLRVNGSQLADGIASAVPSGVVVTGGLAADGSRFARTVVLAGHEAGEGLIAAIGLYGSRLRIGCGSLGGWDAFGPERIVTRAENNVLYELDGRSALSLYKRYLGEHARELPASGLLFPLAIRQSELEEPTVRTILSVDEAAQSMTFAGDLPIGARARLMKANFDRLIDGASSAARESNRSIVGAQAELALLVSCVGRKLVLKHRVEEEVEAVRDVIGAQAAVTGFYSYGEISPFTSSGPCQLHNQTMTITTLAEA